ncbi:MAG: hypothetical protein UW94_C0002G0055 [Parcubacteria group bacterium GW2011_GWA2_45_14]|nr:MAG: hypothetical protein UW94_C0002G0055 [Parcubacteria group bacterium GW2011_GWA2_45_14]
MLLSKITLDDIPLFKVLSEPGTMWTLVFGDEVIPTDSDLVPPLIRGGREGLHG